MLSSKLACMSSALMIAMSLSLGCASAHSQVHSASATVPSQEVAQGGYEHSLINASAPGEDPYYVSTRSEHIIVHGRSGLTTSNLHPASLAVHTDIQVKPVHPQNG